MNEPWTLPVRHPNALPPHAAWQIHADRYVSDADPTFRAYQESRYSSRWNVYANGENVGMVYHVVPRDWVSVFDADNNWIASVRGGFDGREAAMSLLVARATEGK